MRLLLLAGTGEARVLAQRLADMPGIEAVASLAGATRDPRPLPLPIRTGGFGGAAAQAEYMRGFDAVIDATHPFAARISQRTAKICAELGLPHVRLLRPGWTPVAGDDWRMIDHGAEAAAIIPPGSTVFLATGRQTLADYTGLADCRLICRQIDPPDGPFPFPNGDYLVGRPPFSVADETALFKKLGVDWLVVKDAGGAASRTKLDAARDLSIPVLMIRRPQQPVGARVASVDEAVAWVRSL